MIPYRLFTACFAFVLCTASVMAQRESFHGEALGRATEHFQGSELAALDGAFHSWHVYRIDPVAVHAHVASSMNSAAIDLHLGVEHHWDLQLERHGLRAPGMTVRIASQGGGAEILAPAPVDTYRGWVNGDPSQRARFSIRPNEVLGDRKSTRLNSSH